MAEMKAPVFQRLLVIGVGLIGGSVCLGAKKKGMVKHVLGFSRKLETSHEALSLGIIDECISDPSDPNLRNVDAVLLAVPVGQYQKVLRQFLPVLPSGCLIFDAGSTKHDVLKVVDELATQFPTLPARFVGSHPIAGGERHGPAAADAALFDGKTCVVCNDSRLDPVRLQQVQGFWSGLGATVRQMDPLDHDEMFGAVSHLPHFLAFAYVAGVLSHEKGRWFMSEGGAGFRDFTRIAASSPEMWADIFQNNDKALLGMLDRFEEVATRMRKAIESQNREELDSILKVASEYRSSWNG